MTASNHDEQLGEIYPTMLNELNCKFDVIFSRFHSCGRHGHNLWPPWFVAIMVVAVMVYGRHHIDPVVVIVDVPHVPLLIVLQTLLSLAAFFKSG